MLIVGFLSALITAGVALARSGGDIYQTILSFSLEVEVEGVWPWRRWSLTRRGVSDSQGAK